MVKKYGWISSWKLGKRQEEGGVSRPYRRIMWIQQIQRDREPFEKHFVLRNKTKNGGNGMVKIFSSDQCKRKTDTKCIALRR